eukprot:scaffold237752_cov23-Tisochrysis_lutea.AAC.2
MYDATKLRKKAALVGHSQVLDAGFLPSCIKLSSTQCQAKNISEGSILSHALCEPRIKPGHEVIQPGGGWGSNVGCAGSACRRCDLGKVSRVGGYGMWCAVEMPGCGYGMCAVQTCRVSCGTEVWRTRRAST